MTSAANKEPTGLARLAIDIGPLLIFFLTYFLQEKGPERIFIATGVFIAAMIAALCFAAIRYRYISPLLLFSAVAVVIMGGLTIWLHDETFIKMKPTLYYGVVSGLLAFGLVTNRPLLKVVLGTTYPGLDEEGWRKLTRNWAIFFAVMAVANEAVWRNSSDDFWIAFKLWGAIPATLLFALANVPMLLRHGLAAEDQPKPAEPGPIE